MRGFASLALLTMTLTACGGGSGGGDSSEVLTLKAGQSVVLKSGQTAHVPAGTTVVSGGSQTTIQGDDDTVTTSAGATVTVPATATGAADDVVMATASSPAPSANVTLLAGSATTNENPTDGTGAAAVFWGGGQIAVDPQGNLMVSDQGRLRRVTPAGVVTTLAQDSPIVWQGMSIDALGNVFSLGALTTGGAALDQSAVVEYTSAGQASVFASGLDAGGVDAGFGAIAVDQAGDVYVADAVTDQILKLTPTGAASVLASGGQSGTAASLIIGPESGMPIDGAGNLYLLSGDAIRKISPQGTVSTVVSGLGQGVVQPANGGVLARDAAGNFYTGIAGTIYKITAGGVVSSYAALNTTDFITALTADASGHLYAGTRGVGAQIFEITAP